ncbi:DUF3180 family protein [Microbacterium sp. CJ88]|uniref:DUF3180 family protein n=1 Tax=Microbacterium sp. CJ88 TaxID=3445672 RepID=UPI003F6607F1
MKRTGPGILIVAAVLGIAAGFGLDSALTAGGRPTFTPAFTLPILLALLGLFVVVLALPVRRAIRDGSPINPFRAVRTAMLAKASSLVGAAVGGGALGLTFFLLTRPADPSIGSLSATLTTAACGAVLVAAALVAEHLCTIRKDDDDDQPGGSDPGLHHRH